MENQDQENKPTWLEELASKSWSLEMSISGAATLAVSFLPRYINRGLDYYLDNLAPSMSKSALVFPVLAYAFFMVVAYVLIGAFVLHLCYRALWVSLVGLHAAFPRGIQYDVLPNVSVFYKKLVQQRYGSLETYIQQIDKRCNRMFALAFMLAISMSGIGLLYMFFFLMSQFASRFLSVEQIELFNTGLYYSLMALSLLLFTFQWWAKRNPNKEKIGLAIARFQLLFAGIVLPVMRKAMNYITMTFTSNVSRWKYYLAMLLLIVFMMISTVSVTIKKVGDIRGLDDFSDRDYFSAGNTRFRLDQRAYDALRGPDERMPAVSIPNDKISEELLPIFIKYPHYIDQRLKRLCAAEPDTNGLHLGKQAYRNLSDSLHLQCLASFFQLRLNDSIPLQGDWLYTEKNGSKGLLLYTATQHFPSGKNHLSVHIPSEQNADSLEIFGQLPFWMLR